MVGSRCTHSLSPGAQAADTVAIDGVSIPCDAYDDGEPNDEPACTGRRCR